MTDALTNLDRLAEMWAGLDPVDDWRPHIRDAIEEITRLRGALAAPSVPSGEPVAWVRAIDEALVCSHLDVADQSDDYATAKRKLNNLLAYEQSIGAYFASPQPAPAGWRLVPETPTPAMLEVGATHCGTGMMGDTEEAWRVYRAMLCCAPAAPGD